MFVSMLIGWCMMCMLSGLVHRHVMSQRVFCMDCMCIMMFYMMWYFVMRSFMMLNKLWVDNLMSNFMHRFSMMSW